MPILKYVILVTLCVFLVFIFGCLKEKSWYEKYNWKAEDYFDDPKVVMLCKAMETEDLETIDKLIAEGVSVNAKGKKGMQPILWAYPAGEKVFEKILEAGGDPNFVASDTYGTKNGFGPKTTLLYRAAMDYSYKPAYKNYLALLLRYGADPETQNGRAVFFSLGIIRDNDEMIRQFIEAGINLNFHAGNNCYPVTTAATNGRYKALMILLEAGAEYHTDTQAGLRLQNLLYKYPPNPTVGNGPRKKVEEEYDQCIAWLKEHGVSFDKPAEKPEVFREPKEFRKNDNLLKWREKRQKEK